MNNIRGKPILIEKRASDIPYRPLTDREGTVLQLVATGLSNQEIADQLTLSLTTVKWYVKQIFNKLGANRRTQAIHRARVLGLVEQIPPASSLLSTLPTPVTAFIGRERELEQVGQLILDSNIRLVTILGLGGIGKTRLAIECASRLLNADLGPVGYVSLDAVASIDGIIPAVAEAVGFHFNGPVAPKRQLLSSLRGRKLLLVLDNFEHLQEAALLVSEMLLDVLGLKILITSRERLNLHGETVFPLAGLAYAADASDNQDYAAVKLFLQSARRSHPLFEPGHGDLTHINRICHLVEGMPLGLELAAAWMDVLNPEQIVYEIEASLAVLQTSAQDVLERQRSIHAVFEHSWQLLSENERAVFKKLAVFRGGFDRMAAEHVAGATLFMVSTLVDKSLVTRVGVARFKLHELLRQFAEEKLQSEADEYTQALHQHCHYYASLLQHFERIVTERCTIIPTMLDIRRDFDNIVAGWNYAREALLFATLGQSAFSLSLFFGFSGLLTFGEQMFAQAHWLFQAHANRVSPLDRIRVMTHYGYFLCDLAYYEQSCKVLADTLELTPALGDSHPTTVGLLLCFLGWALHLSGQPDAGRERLQQALAISEAADFEFGVLLCYTGLGELEYCVGHYEMALHYHHQALKDSERRQDLAGVMGNLACLGCTYCALGDLTSARNYLRSALTLNRDFLAHYALFMTILGIAAIYEAGGQPEAAFELLVITLYHPQRGGIGVEKIAQLLLARVQSRLPVEYVNSVLDQAKQGRLSSSYLDPQFTINLDLVDQLLKLVG